MKLHPIIRDILDNDRKHDPWGAGMNAGFAICDVLYVLGEDIPAEVQYRPAMALRQDKEALRFDPTTGENAEAHEILCAMDADFEAGHWVEGFEADLTVEDLHFALRVNHHYLNLCKLAGRDY